VACKKGSVGLVQILHPVSEWLELYLFGKLRTSRTKLIALPWCRGWFSHSRSSEDSEPPFNFSTNSRVFYFISFFFPAHTSLSFLLVFKQNLCSLRDTFSFNKNIRDFSLISGEFWKPLFDRFVACNLSVYLLSLAFANPWFRYASICLYFTSSVLLVTLSF